MHTRRVTQKVRLTFTAFSKPRSDFTAAVSALHQAIKLLIQSGNFRQAADREKEVSLQLIPTKVKGTSQADVFSDRNYLRSGWSRYWES